MGVSVRAGWNGLVTVAIGPGIVAHEYAHLLACRLAGVDVRAAPSLNPFGDDAYLDHEPVDSFGVDLAIGVAPLLVNTALALGAFALADRLAAPVAFAFLWLGVCFGLTAFPSDADVDGLSESVRTLPGIARPVGYLVAVPIRAFTRYSLVVGAAAYLWTLALYGLAG